MIITKSPSYPSQKVEKVALKKPYFMRSSEQKTEELVCFFMNRRKWLYFFYITSPQHRLPRGSDFATGEPSDRGWK
jgi:hypothetical protein